ncbi:class I SAM-dependent methyltransferase [Alteromonas sp. KUL49]|uniref:class I SAM-dependent rRNA methyltransferase n=1 Tax=Alteromonas sp. KUL49 TaxID=2480798 RepID=UPI00102F1EFC|nr:class I SAM-dependent methyltransferase [Alteromonas sp. KUL49]TAP40166.1 23S rRNA (cytosine(1962)-C(5))-methyltransferase RlmI [Alteromonas sp. KUL49]GEA11286.1 ribosomal RNA large subunit methyltransferase I [Alteromonas sp. KUL49]
MSATITLQPTREKSLKRRHPWVFESAIATVKGRARSGDTVEVLSSTGEWLGRGAYSPESQIRVRMWTFDKSESIDNVFFLKKFTQALALRTRLFDLDQTNSFRWIASENDGLPGVTVDLYDNVAVLQLLSAGAEKHRSKIVWAITKLMPDVHVYERSDVDVRKKEGLEPTTGVVHGEPPAQVTVKENGLNIIVDIEKGHKTGFYLDQRDSRAAAARYAKGAHVLNCFSYTGTFSCFALQGGAASVTNVDVSQPALDIAKQHVDINQLNAAKAHYVNQDVFQALRHYHEQKQQFDMVILDPPKFVDSKASLKRASRGYKDINLYGIHAVKSGGLLLTFSCSGLMPADLFQKIVADAALDAGRTIKIIERLNQASDHPIIGSYPEGYYLKGLVCEVTD